MPKQYYGSGKRSEDNSKSLKDKKIIQYYMKKISKYLIFIYLCFTTLSIYYNPLYVVLAFRELKHIYNQKTLITGYGKDKIRKLFSIKKIEKHNNR